MLDIQGMLSILDMLGILYIQGILGMPSQKRRLRFS